MSLFSRHGRIAGALTSGVAVIGCLSISAGSAVAAPGRAVIPGTHPAWAVRSHQTSSAAVTSGSVDLRVYLAGQNAAGLASYAQAVSDPASASYGAYLTAAQVQARFGSTAAQARTVESFLTGAGMTVTDVTSGIGAYVGATGTVAQASSAFGVAFADYTDSQGQTARAPEAAATVPSSVSADVSAVAGLNTASNYVHPGDTLPPPGQNYWIASPTSSYYGQSTATHEPTAGGRHWPWTVAGYTPQQIRGAYGVTASDMTGAGQTVAIVDAYASPTMQNDADEFSRVTGNQPFRRGQYQQFLARSFDDTSADECDAQGWYGEETLDVESVHDMAPDANVKFIGAQDCTDPGLLAADALVVNDHLATIVSNSWVSRPTTSRSRRSTTRCSRPERPRGSGSSSHRATAAMRTRTPRIHTPISSRSTTRAPARG